MKGTKPNAKTTIQVSDELRQTIKMLAAYKNTTYEDLLAELLAGELSKMNINGIANKLKKKHLKKRK